MPRMPDAMISFNSNGTMMSVSIDKLSFKLLRIAQSADVSAEDLQRIDDAIDVFLRSHPDAIREIVAFNDSNLVLEMNALHDTYKQSLQFYIKNNDVNEMITAILCLMDLVNKGLVIADCIDELIEQKISKQSEILANYSLDVESAHSIPSPIAAFDTDDLLLEEAKRLSLQTAPPNSPSSSSSESESEEVPFKESSHYLPMYPSRTRDTATLKKVAASGQSQLHSEETTSQKEDPLFLLALELSRQELPAAAHDVQLPSFEEKKLEKRKAHP